MGTAAGDLHVRRPQRLALGQHRGPKRPDVHAAQRQPQAGRARVRAAHRAVQVRLPARPVAAHLGHGHLRAGSPDLGSPVALAGPCGNGGSARRTAP